MKTTEEKVASSGKIHIDLKTGLPKLSVIDKNGMPDTLEVGIYYYIDEDGKKVYDEECMREEFEAMIEFLTKKT